MRWLLLACASLAVGSSARAGDWPQWLGPNRDGTSSEIAKPWHGDPKVLWRTEVGEGHSSPVVHFESVFLHDKAPGKDAERLRVWEGANGRLKGEVEHA